MRRTMFPLALGFLVGAACSKSEGTSSTGSDTPNKPVEVKYGGVDPAKFDCKSIASHVAIGTLLGGTATKVEAVMMPEPGVAKACAYDVEMPAPPPPPPKPGDKKPPAGSGSDKKPPEPTTIIEKWSFDFDCRPTYKKIAETSMAQFRQKSDDAVKHYNEVMDAGAGKSFNASDAGVEVHTAPSGASDVTINGQKGVDVLGQAVLFVDDDAPCFVRVVGPDAPRRLELAKMVGKNLTFANAPMKPRPFP